MNTPPLNAKNLEILCLLSQGLTYKEIGARVYLSYDAVKKRVESLREKTGCRTTHALIFYFSEQIKNARKFT